MDDYCLRAQYEQLSEQCAAASALVDEAAAEMPHHKRGVCPVMVGLSIAFLAGLVVLARKFRAKKRVRVYTIEWRNPQGGLEFARDYEKAEFLPFLVPEN